MPKYYVFPEVPALASCGDMDNTTLVGICQGRLPAPSTPFTAPLAGGLESSPGNVTRDRQDLACEEWKMAR